MCIHMCVCMYMCAFICVHVWRGGEREEERERLGCGEDRMNEQHADQLRTNIFGSEPQ